MSGMTVRPSMWLYFFPNAVGLLFVLVALFIFNAKLVGPISFASPSRQSTEVEHEEKAGRSLIAEQKRARRIMARSALFAVKAVIFLLLPFGFLVLALWELPYVPRDLSIDRQSLRVGQWFGFERVIALERLRSIETLERCHRIPEHYLVHFSGEDVWTAPPVAIAYPAFPAKEMDVFMGRLRDAIPVGQFIPGILKRD